LHEGGRGNYRDASERVEREQIGIAGDDETGTAIYLIVRHSRASAHPISRTGDWLQPRAQLR
jgi:hypothetical protein